ncbi:hypothetical protein BGW38_002648 [Lunasporangiospora selenospora]|uniref:Uncharacterized protein n=1 Tax=Lunasporangiospora selenospora TaxID=979761 RepID=A0A9P6KDD7_9FUNG|nr:hypothetical protein BGW38_002648 [Lunasporangiospora selenospora]
MSTTQAPSRTGAWASRPWVALAATSTLLSLLIPTLVSAAPSSLSSSSSIQKRAAVSYVETSLPTIDLTFHGVDRKDYTDKVKLNECFSAITLPIDNHVRNYTAITSNSAKNFAINFYMDDQCTEYDYSVVGDLNQYQNSFASILYVGQYNDAKPGFYENREFSKTTLPDQGTGGAGGDGSSGTGSAGFAVGVGIIGMVILMGVIALGVVGYRKFQSRYGRKRGDGVFMTLATERDDDDDGENGPHSSALMQSRVGVSFDEERYPTNYRDDNDNASDADDDDDEVELGGYPQNPTGPTQKVPDHGIQPLK